MLPRRILWLKELKGHKQSYFQWLMFFKSIKYFKPLDFFNLQKLSWVKIRYERQGGTISNIYWMTTGQTLGKTPHIPHFVSQHAVQTITMFHSWTLVWEARKRMVLKGSSLQFWKPYKHWSKVPARRHFHMAIDSREDSFSQNWVRDWQPPLGRAAAS